MARFESSFGAKAFEKCSALSPAEWLRRCQFDGLGLWPGITIPHFDKALKPATFLRGLYDAGPSSYAGPGVVLRKGVCDKQRATPLLPFCDGEIVVGGRGESVRSVRRYPNGVLRPSLPLFNRSEAWQIARDFWAEQMGSQCAVDSTRLFSFSPFFPFF